MRKLVCGGTWCLSRCRRSLIRYGRWVVWRGGRRGHGRRRRGHRLRVLLLRETLGIRLRLTLTLLWVSRRVTIALLRLLLLLLLLLNNWRLNIHLNLAVVGSSLRGGVVESEVVAVEDEGCKMEDPVSR